MTTKPIDPALCCQTCGSPLSKGQCIQAANEKRIADELKVMERLVEELLCAGCKVSVDDGEDVTLANSTEKAAILHAMRTTDEDYLHVQLPTGGKGVIHMVYGNDPWEVVSDHSTRLSSILADFDKFIATYDNV